MNAPQLEYFIERYARMSDEELSYLMVTRGSSLSEEASQALRTVLATRNQPDFARELSATACDQQAQLLYEEDAVKRAEQSAATLRRVVHVGAGLLIVVGIVAALAMDAGPGWPMVIVGVGLLLYFELKRLFWRFIRALFDPNAS